MHTFQAFRTLSDSAWSRSPASLISSGLQTGFPFAVDSMHDDADSMAQSPTPYVSLGLSIFLSAFAATQSTRSRPLNMADKIFILWPLKHWLS